MRVRCPECGHDNEPQYRFCGMCGTALPLPRETGRPTVRETRGEDDDIPLVSGPSFLGLEGEPTRTPHYLLEDEPPRSHWRLYLALVLLLAAAGGLYWHWRLNGYPWETRPWERITATNPQTTPPTTGPADATPTAPAAAGQTAAGQTEDKPTSAPAPENPAAGIEEQPSAEQPEEKTEPKAEEKSQIDVRTLEPKASSEQDATPQEDMTAEEDATAKPAPPPAKPPKMQPTRKEPATTVPPEDPTDAMVSDGQKYLYGTGVPENCALARKNLLAAAARANSKAQSTVGAMYATGHCVERNLPSAYRWFARALHQDTTNVRLQQNLEVLWRQMTPEERQQAMQRQ